MKPHILILNHWLDKARYSDYVDHERTTVTYVCSPQASAGVPKDAVAAVTVADTAELGPVRDAVAELIEHFGIPDRIVALGEDDLMVAAELRAEWGIAGDRPDDIRRFRDKLWMATSVARAGIDIPDFADAPDREAVAQFAQEHGWPVIVKPRWGSGARDIVRLDSPDDLRLVAGSASEPRLVQKYCADTIIHVDGLWTGRELGPWRAARYLNTFVEFWHGRAIGSVEIDDDELLSHVGEFTARVGAAMSERPWVFHLEAFLGQADSGIPLLQFLEVGARVGGAEIPYIWREVHDRDPFIAATAIQLGDEPDADPLKSDRVGGWLLVPTPVSPPCIVVSADFGIPLDAQPYARFIPAGGVYIPWTGDFNEIGGRFRYAGGSTAEVEHAMRRTMAEYRIDCVFAAPDTVIGA